MDSRSFRSRTFRIRLDADDVGRLQGAAARRGVYPETLLGAISRTVLRDQLVNAVLDDDKFADSSSQQMIGAGHEQ